MSSHTSLGMRSNMSGSLCYLMGWVSGIFFLIMEKDNKFVLFHARQSTLFFGFLTVLGIAVLWIPVVGWALEIGVWLVGMISWRFLSYMAYSSQMYYLPIVGKLAERRVHPEVIVSPAEMTRAIAEDQTDDRKYGTLSY